MKKVLATALVALMVTSTVFAAFSGSATTSFGYNIDEKTLGFTNGGNTVKFNVSLASEAADKKAEGGIYATIKGSLSYGFNNGNGSAAPTTSVAPEFAAKITEAKVNGENWYVSILGAGSGVDFAVSALDKNGNDFITYNSGYAAPAPGVEVGLFDYTFGLGATSDIDAKTYALKGYAKTPEYTLAEGFKLQAGAQASAQNGVAKTFGGGLAASYTGVVNVKGGLDLGLSLLGEDVKFDMDTAVQVAYAPVTWDLYFSTVGKLLSTQVAADLNSVKVPLTITLAGKDLINKQDLSLELGTKIDALNATVSGGYVIGNKTWNAKVSADYTLEKVGKLYVETAFAGADKLTSATVTAGLENKTLVSGATLALEYASGNYVDKKAGAINASCTIAF